jgi:2-epi-5-epi-valiolone synthase
MIVVKGEKTYSYSITKTENIFDIDNDSLLSGGDAHAGARRFVVIDKNVHTLYRPQIEHYFAERRVLANIKLVDAGDRQKSETNYISVFRELCQYDLKRRSEPIIAIGGGVVTDLAGFVASTYRRGIPHLKVPTTLMGYVDASVGIKTGVNFGPFKNRMGSFETPAGVILDKSFLQTLDRRNLVNGIGEIVKLAVILDAGLFDDLERGRDSLVSTQFQDGLGQTVLDKAILGMVGELSPNLYETELQRKVDFGHTFSLAIESASNYEIMHGEAVAIDILFSSYLAVQRGLLSKRDFERIVALYKSLGMPMWSDCITPDLFWDGVKERVMHRDGKQLIPIPTAIGACDFINDLRRDEIRRAVEALEMEFSNSEAV